MLGGTNRPAAILDMKILVCISHVPDTTAKIQFTADGRSLDANGVQFVINPYDEFGLTRALQLNEQLGGTVTAVTVGDAGVEPTLRKALAIGAHDAVRVDAQPTDPMQVARELAAVVSEGGYDVVICGQESIDYNGGIVPSALAELLGWPVVTPCIGFTPEGSRAKASREIDGGKEVLDLALPVVLGAKKGLVEESELRIPNMRGIMAARTKPLTVKAAAGAAAGSAPVSFTKPAGKSAVQMIDANDLDALVKKLHEEAKVI
jgi:electron transfer flavoprotein beta subunit